MFWNQYAHSMRRLTSHAGCLAESWFQAIMFMLYTNASIHKENHFLHRLCISYQTWLKASDDSVKPSLPVSTPIHLCKYQLGSSSAALQAGQWSTSYLIGVRSDRRHHHLMRKAAAFLINRLTSPSSSARNFMHVPSSIDRPCHIGTCIFIHYIYSYIYIYIYSYIYIYLLFEYSTCDLLFEFGRSVSSPAASTDIDCFYTCSLCAVLRSIHLMHEHGLQLDLIKWMYMALH